MTPGYFSSGTDRVAFVAKAEGRSNIIVNIQADEPLISPRHLNLLVETLKKNPKCCIATLCVKKDSRVELHDQNVVKVEFSPTGDATIFSRVPTSQGTVFYKHIGIYAYRKETLDLFCHLKPSIQEQEERLEQLRAIAYGIPIRVIEIDQDTVAVDNPSDIMKVEQFLKMTQNPANEPEERKFL